MRWATWGATGVAAAWACAPSAMAQSVETDGGRELTAPRPSAPDERAPPDSDADSEVDVVSQEPSPESPQRPLQEALHLPSPPHLRLDADRLGAFFQDQAESERDGMLITGVLTSVGGSLNLGVGLWLMLDDETFAGMDVLRIGGGAVAILTGLMSVVNGIYGLTSIGPAQDRLRRWRAALEGGLDERELGRFEGELRAEAETARVLRSFSAVAGFGMLAGGVVLALATALGGFDDLGQGYGYGLGGLFSVVGAITGIDALISESRAEANWRRYREGEGPESSIGGVELDVAPIVTEHGFGMSLRGRF